MDYAKAQHHYLSHRAALLKPREVLGVGIGIRDPGGHGVPATYEIVVLSAPVKPADVLYPAEGPMLESLGDALTIRAPDLTVRGEPPPPFEPPEPDLGPICDANPDFALVSAPQVHVLQAQPLGGVDASVAQVRGDILVIRAAKDIVVTDDAGNLHMDWVAAFQILLNEVSNDFHFVLFSVDENADLPHFGTHHRAVCNLTRGIGHPEGHAFDERCQWGSCKLESVQCIMGPAGVRTTLHETGHRWCAYGAGKLDMLHQNNLQYDQRLLHWGFLYDSDESCMDYDHMDWSPREGGGYVTVRAAGTPSFSNLDRYLSGFVPFEDLQPARYFPQSCVPMLNSVYAGNPAELSREDIVNALGARVPPCPGTLQEFRQAFVFITTRDPESKEVLDLLDDLDLVRRQHEEVFAAATGGAATVDTRLFTEVSSADDLPVPDDGDSAVHPPDEPPVEEPKPKEGVIVPKKKRRQSSGQADPGVTPAADPAQGGQGVDPQAPVHLVKVRIRNTTGQPLIVKIRAVADPDGGGIGSGPRMVGLVPPIPPDDEQGLVYDIAEGEAVNIYQIEVCAQQYLGAPFHWVCSLSDDEPVGSYPKSACFEFTPDMEPLARGMWGWMLNKTHAMPDSPGHFLHTVVLGPLPGAPF